MIFQPATLKSSGLVARDFDEFFVGKEFALHWGFPLIVLISVITSHTLAEQAESQANCRAILTPIQRTTVTAMLLPTAL